MTGTRYDLPVVPGERLDRVVYWQVSGTGARLSLDGWTPVLVIERENQPLYSSAGPEPDLTFAVNTSEVGRIDLSLGFDFTAQLFRPFDSPPELRYFAELVDDTLDTNTVPLLWGLVTIEPRYPA